MKALYWLLRRELWENRSLYRVPAGVGAVVLLAAAVAVGVTGSWSSSATAERVVQLHETQMEENLGALREREREIARRRAELLQELEALRRQQGSAEPGPELGQGLEEAGRRLAAEALRGLKEVLAPETLDATVRQALEQARQGIEQTRRELERERREGERPPETDQDALERRMEEQARGLALDALELATRVLAETEDLGGAIGAELQQELEAARRELEEEAAGAGAPADAARLQERIERIRTLQQELTRLEAESADLLEAISRQIQVRERGSPLAGEGSLLHRILSLYAGLDQERRRAVLTGIAGGLGMLMLVATVLTVAFYSADALYAERRDRSALFWKSLPVGEGTTVASKLAAGLLLAPMAAWLALVLTQVLLLAGATLLLGSQGLPAGELLWGAVPWADYWTGLAATTLALSLWLWPVAGWLLLVSALVPRNPLVVATVLPLLLALAERWILGTGWLAHALGQRYAVLRQGPGEAMFTYRDRGADAADTLWHSELELHFGMGEGGFEAGSLLSMPAFWIGIVVALALAALTVAARRYRDEA